MIESVKFGNKVVEKISIGKTILWESIPKWVSDCFRYSDTGTTTNGLSEKGLKALENRNKKGLFDLDFTNSKANNITTSQNDVYYSERINKAKEPTKDVGVIKELILKDTMGTIPPYSFLGNSIEKVDLKNVKKIGSLAFRMNNLKEVIIPEDCVIEPTYTNTMDKESFETKARTSNTSTLVEELSRYDTGSFDIDTKIFVRKRNGSLVRYRINPYTKSDFVTRPSKYDSQETEILGLTESGKRKLAKTKYLTFRAFNESDNKIRIATISDNYLAKGLKVDTVEFGGNLLEETGIDSFKDSGVKEIIFSEDSKIRYISSNSFQNCNVKKVTLLEGITDVSTFAFESSNIEEVIFPDTIKNIRQGSFLHNKIKRVAVVDSCNIEHHSFDAGVPIYRYPTGQKPKMSDSSSKALDLFLLNDLQKQYVFNNIGSNKTEMLNILKELEQDDTFTVKYIYKDSVGQFSTEVNELMTDNSIGFGFTSAYSNSGSVNAEYKGIKINSGSAYSRDRVLSVIQNEKNGVRNIPPDLVFFKGTNFSEENDGYIGAIIITPKCKIEGRSDATEYVSPYKSDVVGEVKWVDEDEANNIGKNINYRDYKHELFISDKWDNPKYLVGLKRAMDRSRMFKRVGTYKEDTVSNLNGKIGRNQIGIAYLGSYGDPVTSKYHGSAKIKFNGNTKTFGENMDKAGTFLSKKEIDTSVENGSPTYYPSSIAFEGVDFSEVGDGYGGLIVYEFSDDPAPYSWNEKKFTFRGDVITGLSDKGKELLSSKGKISFADLPSRYDEIDADAFEGNYSIKEIDLGRNIRYIGNYAFKDCNIQQLRIPSNISTIGYGAFAYNPIYWIVFDDDCRTWVKRNAFASLARDFKVVSVPYSVDLEEYAFDEDVRIDRE